MKQLILALMLALFAPALVAGPVNINTADAKTLSKELSGIGPAKAAAIVKHRQEKGRFNAPKDLMKVEGVGTATYDSNKDNIKVSD